MQTLRRGIMARIVFTLRAVKTRVIFSKQPALRVCTDYKHTRNLRRAVSISRGTQNRAGYYDLFCGSWNTLHFRNCSTSTSISVESVPDKKILSVSPVKSGKNLFVKWDDGEESRLLSQWLRFNCQCPECVSPASNQRMLYADKLLSWPRISSATIKGVDILVATNTCQLSQKSNCPKEHVLCVCCGASLPSFLSHSQV